jgi:hypothetical protein
VDAFSALHKNNAKFLPQMSLVLILLNIGKSMINEISAQQINFHPYCRYEGGT